LYEYFAQLRQAQAMNSDTAMSREADRVRASGLLGESRLRSLFDYLLDKSMAGHSPKEIEIAIDVFGKTADFDVSQDALVRVYIHKLRKTLERVYAAGGDGDQLQLQRGEYRLRLRPRTLAPDSTDASRAPARFRAWLVAGVVGAALGAAITATVIGLRTPDAEVERARASPVWSVILKDDRPILVVVGDYYLIGETDASMEVKRLVREFTVNSKSDLDDYLQQHPEAADKYMDVGIRYLPTATAFALRDVMSMLAPASRRVSVRMMSNVQPGDFKSSDIVYIGFLSGMGMFQDLVFGGSRFVLGESYDELIDRQTKHSYTSQTGDRYLTPSTSVGGPGGDAPYRDYGYFADFRGPSGNTLIVISGTRDEGVRQTAEAFTNPQKLEELGRRGEAGAPFEALLEVSALDGVNLNGKLLIQSKR
jgi:hypothetical protein